MRDAWKWLINSFWDDYPKWSPYFYVSAFLLCVSASVLQIYYCLSNM